MLKDLFQNPQKYAKFWISLAAPVGVLVFACAPQMVDGVEQAAFVVTPAEWYQVLVALAVSVGVYQVPNKKV